MNRIIGIFIAMIVLGGCASGINGGYSSYERYQIELIQPITVKAGSSYAYVTAPGKVVNRKEIGTYELYCKISIPRSSESEELIIAPDTFEINNIYRRYSGYFPGFQDDYQVAYNGFGGGIFGHHRSSKQDLELFLEIDSVNQPLVKSISCIRFADPYFGYSPTLEEAMAVFNGLAEFKSY